MSDVSYDHVDLPIRDEVVAAQQLVWKHIAKSGTWLTGGERVSIAAETRAALNCDLCTERKAALSPFAVEGEHDHLGALVPPMVEAIHRIRTDPGRLTRAWRDGLAAEGLDDERYVELVGTVASTVAVDQFCVGLGIEPFPLPAPVAGEPSYYRPDGLSHERAWVPLINPKTVGPNEADLYANSTGAYIRQAMSLVPDEVRGFFALVASQYLDAEQMHDVGTEYRAITHAQIEFVAARVSALNQCVY
jgi:hypothetical protein